MPDLVAGLPLELAHLSWLVGQWQGVGTGHYPTIEAFRFGQHVSIACDGRPFLSYTSRSWLIDEEGQPARALASESGFWRPRPDNGVELLLSHPMGYAEVWHGTVTIKAIESARITRAELLLRTELVARTSTAKEYTSGERRYGAVDGRLVWTFDMKAMGQPMGNHLAAQLWPIRDTVPTR